MPNPALEQAIREAYASAPSDTVILHTLELRHPAFMDDEGEPTAIRVVRNFADQESWLSLGGAEVQAVLDAMPAQARDLAGLVARLEADAPKDPGRMVPFIALGFELELPTVDTAPVPEISVTLDNVSRRDRPPSRCRGDQHRDRRGDLPALSLDRPRGPADGPADHPHHDRDRGRTCSGPPVGRGCSISATRPFRPASTPPSGSPD